MREKLTHRTGAKLAAAFLLTLSLLAAAAGGVLVIGALEYDAYGVENYWETRDALGRIESKAALIYEVLTEPGYVIREYDSAMDGAERVRYEAAHFFAASRNNILFELLDAEGTVVASTCREDIPLVRETELRYDNDWLIRLGIRAEPLTGAYDISEETLRGFDFFHTFRKTGAVLAAVGALLSAALLVFLFFAAGHRPGTDAIVLRRVDRIPLDLLAALCVFGTLLCAMLAREAVSFSFAVAVGIAVGLPAGLILLMSFAVRCKAGGVWKNTLLRRAARLAGRLGRLLLRALRALPMMARSAAVLTGAVLPEALLALAALDSSRFRGELFLLFLVYNALLLAAALFAVWQMRLLRTAAKKLAAGELSYRLGTKHLYWEFRRHAEDLNAVGKGMGAAVEQRMRSERLKTELITNVSHDIKTPLTSIVSYVELLRRPELTEADRAEYLEVLARQSARLRKLTEDLVEASKASTGNLPVCLVPTNLEELLHQAEAEYADRLSAAGLTAVLTAEEGLTALADGRLLWRVLDNLLGNACKYALPGTRVYLSASRSGAQARLSVKNISREQLNVSPEELLERFVRGDSSRSTEGSGLGLSIARSLTELQGGSFSLTVDGDLFKAELLLNC